MAKAGWAKATVPDYLNVIKHAESHKFTDDRDLYISFPWYLWRPEVKLILWPRQYKSIDKNLKLSYSVIWVKATKIFHYHYDYVNLGGSGAKCNLGHLRLLMDDHDLVHAFFNFDMRSK